MHSTVSFEGDMCGDHNHEGDTEVQGAAGGVASEAKTVEDEQLKDTPPDWETIELPPDHILGHRE